MEKPERLHLFETLQNEVLAVVYNELDSVEMDKFLDILTSWPVSKLATHMTVQAIDEGSISIFGNYYWKAVHVESIPATCGVQIQAYIVLNLCEERWCVPTADIRTLIHILRYFNAKPTAERLR